MPNFADALVQLFDDLRDDAECEYWQCPRAGAQPHDRNCLTGNPAGEDD
ncbi:hypothetical protein [Streptomyces ardesiacus]